MLSKRMLVLTTIVFLAFTAMGKNPPKLRGPKPPADISGKPQDDGHVAPPRGSREYPWQPGMDASRLPLPAEVEEHERSARVALAWLDPTALAVGPSIVWVNNIEVSSSANDPDFEVATAVLAQNGVEYVANAWITSANNGTSPFSIRTSRYVTSTSDTTRSSLPGPAGYTATPPPST